METLSALLWFLFTGCCWLTPQKANNAELVVFFDVVVLASKTITQHFVRQLVPTNNKEIWYPPITGSSKVKSMGNGCLSYYMEDTI